tara:strand:+ start:378 stop:542 length:165 start_codon:yes stop_codon:yes gene_type:complete
MKSEQPNTVVGTETQRLEEGKIIAERLNGYAAIFGCAALITAYATTGQIIPGFV